MTKKLLVVAASGLVLAILLLSAAWVTGGTALLNAAHHGGWHFIGDDDDHGPTSTRTLAFDSAVPLTVDTAVDLNFVRGDHAGMTISGPAGLVSAVHWESGRLSLDGAPHWGPHATLTVEIVAPRLPPLTFAGAGDVSLVNLAQDDLHLDLSGAGDIEASGKVRNLAVTVSGVGSADLAKLEATDATVTASGVGNIDLNASGKVDASVSGVGNVSLHRKPAELTSRISGVGSVDENDD